MEVTAKVQLLGKIAKPWTDKDGKDHTSYKGHIGQNQLSIVETINLTREQFTQLEAGKSYTLTADYGVGKNGAYLRINSFMEIK